MTPSFAFASVIRDLEARLLQQLPLSPVSLPDGLSALQGAWKGVAATLTARAYQGPGIRFARVVELSGGDLDVANLLALPAPDLAAPVLGVDLVAATPDAGLVVADVTPMVDPRPAAVAASGTARAARPEQSGLPSAGELPAWARTWFSDHYLFARIGPSQRAEAEACLRTFVDRFTLELRHAPRAASAHAVARRQADYCDAHLTDDRGLAMLRRLFEPSAAERFLREVMFPSPEPARW